MKILENKGMPVRGTLAQIIVGNLGIYSILGFMESFSANNFCHLYLIYKVLSQDVFFSEDDPRLTLRTKTVKVQHSFPH